MTDPSSARRFSSAQLRTTGAVLLGVGIVLMLALGVNVGGAVASVVFLVGVVMFIVGSLRVRSETRSAAAAATARQQKAAVAPPKKRDRR